MVITYGRYGVVILAILIIGLGYYAVQMEAQHGVAI